jgi:hypothetical protein
MLNTKNPDQRLNPEREQEMRRQLQELARQQSHNCQQSKEFQKDTLKNGKSK